MPINKDNEKLQVTISKRLGEIIKKEGNKLGLRKAQMAGKILLEKYEKELINMDEKTMITAKGLGMGAKQKFEVYSREKILQIIDKLDKEEIVRKAWEAFNQEYKTGYAILNFETGKLESLGLSSNESLQAIDSLYITLYNFNQNFNISDMNLINYDEDNNEIPFESKFDEIEAMFEEIIYQDNIIDDGDIKRQLDFMYNEDE